jgi:YVTN family beta-propeller protein
MTFRPLRTAGLAILVASLIVPGAARAAEAGVYLYLQPLAPEAGRLSFTLASVAAIGADGREHTLTLRLSDVNLRTAGRQRLLASGRVPIGRYAGLLVNVKTATLERDGEKAALSVPDPPTRIAAQFSAGAEQPAVLWLVLRYDESIKGVEFTPRLTVAPPPRPIADHMGFVTNARSNTITVFDKSLGQAINVIETCAGPAGMALDQRRRRLYVACSRDDEIQSIDVATGTIVERTRISPGDRPRELALSPDGLTLVAVAPGSGTVSFFDATSAAHQDRVAVGSGPEAIAIDPAGRRAFVLNRLGSSVSVVEISSRTVAATVSLEAAPLRAEFNRQGDRLYVIHERSPYMTVFDPRQLTVLQRARVRGGVGAIAVDTVRNLVCLAGENDPAIEIYDPHALMPLYAIRTPAGASYLTFDAEANRLYLVEARAGRIAVASLADRRVVTEIDVGDAPYGVSVMGER